jgi:hypothetical protein
MPKGYEEGQYDKRQQDKGSATEEVKMFLARENTRALINKLSLPSLSPFDLKCVLTMAFSSRTKADNWKEKIDNYTSGKMPIPDKPGSFYTDPYQDPEFKKAFENACLGEFIDLRAGLDATSRVAMSDFDLKSNELAYIDLNPKYFLTWAGAGRLLLLCGEKDSGKTDFACTVIDIAMQEGWRVFGNIEMEYDSPETVNYHYCRTFSEMLLLVCEAKLAGIKTLLVIDETGLEFASYDASTKSWKEIDRFHKVTRKLGVAEIWMTQYYEQCPWIITHTWSAYIEKMDKTLMRYHIRVGRCAKQNNMITSVPRTRLPFSTYHISSMKIDLSMTAILDMLQSLPPRANQFAEIMKFVKDMKLKEAKELTTEEKKIVAKKLIEYREKNPGVKLSDKIVSEIVGANTKSIYRWKQEMGKEKTPVQKTDQTAEETPIDDSKHVEAWDLPEEEADE